MTEERRIHRILLVEDDRSIQALVAEAFKPFDVVVVGVVDGRDAIPRALDVLPDLVLLDIALPGMGGWDILAELRALEDTADVPVVIITAHGQSDWEAAALRRGANRFIEKPFRVATLVREITAMLENGHSELTAEDDGNP